MEIISAFELLFLTICSITSSFAKDGFILTVPNVLRHGTKSEFCVTVYADDKRSRPITITLMNSDDGETKALVETLYTPGTQKCTSFMVPEPGVYELLMSNETDILHDAVEVYVFKEYDINLVQTDKPIYTPGQKVKFRVMTLLKDLTPRIGKINSIYIMDPNDIRVKQFLNVDTNGLTSLQFQLSSQAKLGEWKISLLMDDNADGSSKPMITTFKVEEYVLPKFEVEITPPPYILAGAEMIEGKVCAKYTYGKPVQGFLDLKVCWGYRYGSKDMPCSQEIVKINGCYNFTANMTKLENENGYSYYGSQLQITASVIEYGTGARVNKTHDGPSKTHQPLNIKLEDFTNGFFKPRLPYVGKVIVTRPDYVTPAAGEIIRITANDYKNKIRYTMNFTTSIDGTINYALCDGFNEDTTSISIKAEAVMYEDDSSLPYGRRLSTPREFKDVRQWFSPSLSYIQVPSSDSKLKCGSTQTYGIPFTTRAGRNVTFTYQVLARGQIVKTGQVTVNTSDGMSSNDFFKPPQSMCLQWEEEPTPPPQPEGSTKDDTPIEITLTKENEVVELTDLVPPEPESESMPSEPDTDLMPPMETDVLEPDVEIVPPPPEPTDKANPRDAILIPEPEEPPRAFEEEIIRPEILSDSVSTLLIHMDTSTIMAPKFTLLVYHVMSDGEVVADSMEFEVEPCLANNVDMSFNTSTALPGQNVGIDLKAAPGSVCGIGIVDKSINLLGGNHQITKETVFKKIVGLSVPDWASVGWFHSTSSSRADSKYCEERIKRVQDTDDDEGPENYSQYWHYTSPYVDASEAFKDGFTVLTNLDLETRPCKRDFPVYYYDHMGSVGPIPLAQPMARRGEGRHQRRGGEMSNQPKAPRTNFPETWLWDIVVVGDKGQESITETAPDTITSWTGNALCLDKTKGFGVSPLASVTTFQPFFLSLRLPYAAVRGERLTVILTVFNYLDKCLKIQYALDGGEGIHVMHNRRHKKPVCVCGGQSHSARFYTSPRAIGSLSLMAKAVVVPGVCGNAIETDSSYEGYSDAVQRKMLVKAEGVTQEYTSTMYMCANAKQPKSESVILPLPQDIVKDSAIGELHVIGDIMGPALSNLDKLVRMPTGCGEQNMVGFVPNILVLKYLSKTGRLTEEIHDNAIKFMEAGYQRELKYRHKDGSYSAFGENKDGDPGSIWLTAFVVKSFAQAQPYIYIDEADMALSLSFIRRNQLETGCFRETGKVFSSYMMGGLGKNKKKDSFTALTAYILVALLKANVSKTDRVIEQAVKCINKDFKRKEDKLDAYTLALVAYANTLYDPYDSLVVGGIMKTLDNKAKKDGSYRYWKREGDKPKPVNTWYYYAAPSAEVEMTSYALLSYLTFYGQKAVEQAYDIAMWISQQRSPRGGFASTQDTVIGLNALAEFAEFAFSSDPTNVEVAIEGTDLDVSMSVSEEGKTTLLLQTAPIKTLPNKINVKVRGAGCALVQANVQYNKMPRSLMAAVEGKPSFSLKVSPKLYSEDIDRCDRKTIDIHVSARGPQKFSVGMTLVTVRMVTGWSPIKESFVKLESQFPLLGIKRYEHNEEEGLLTFYFEEMNRQPKRFSIDVEQDKDLRVSSPKAADVRVYQYYETDVSLTQSYKMRTICGTKLSIPRNPKAFEGQPSWVQRRIDTPSLPGSLVKPVGVKPVDTETNATSAAVSACPVCVMGKMSPDYLKNIFCNSSAVYKTVSGRTGVKPLKIRQNLRHKKKAINIFAKFDMSDKCDCSLLAPPMKRVLIFTKNKLTDMRKLKFDGTFTIAMTSRKIEKEIKKLHRSC